MMELPINLPELEDNTLKLIVPRVMGKPKVMYNGREVQKQNNRFSISNGSGQPILITLKNNYLDSVPKVFINDQEKQIVKPLKWYEYIWMGLPILMALQGGILGALLGFVAIRLNSIIFRNDKSQVVKYLTTLGVNVLIVTLYLVVVVLLSVVLNRNK
ncbi:hypothetical protein [Prolixibacter denitrificans]|jgi:hypothetical protein|nr:hypothetical protein [Prolixibacter denitrificans]